VVIAAMLDVYYTLQQCTFFLQTVVFGIIHQLEIHGLQLTVA